MISEILQALGGIGLFLLGMLALTDGLRKMAGHALRRMLAEYTRTPLRGAVAGAIATAVIQSSSATTVTAVGFVGAGLLTFSQGLGIIFGANIGTTMTGWLVALLGFKLKIGAIALPLVLAGVMLRLFGRGKYRDFGWALAGFGLLFVGIATLQGASAQLEGVVTPDIFPDDTLFGRLQLVAIGMGITLATQSSSAGVAVALVALAVGNITLPQAAALVIGMDVGTTFTAVLATVGGSASMRQTGFAHVFYNLLTGILAFCLLDAFAAMASSLDSAGENAQISLVAFHTIYNVLGVILILPFADGFARIITRLFPEAENDLLTRLDEKLLGEPASALDAAAATVSGIAMATFSAVRDRADPARDWHETTAIAAALDRTGSFLEKIEIDPADRPSMERFAATMHAIDHLHRLEHRCGQDDRIAELRADPGYKLSSRFLISAIDRELTDPESLPEEKLARMRDLMRRQYERVRRSEIARSARVRSETASSLRRMDVARWLERVAHHLWRVRHHVQRARSLAPAAADMTEQAIDRDEE